MGTGLIILNISLEMAGIMLCIMGVILVMMYNTLEQRAAWNLLGLFMCLMFYLAVSILCVLSQAGLVQLSRGVIAFCRFEEYLMAFLLLAIFSSFVVVLPTEPKVVRRYVRVLLAMVAVHAVMVVLNQLYGFLFTLDDQNLYRRGPAYPLAFLMPLLLVSMCVGILITRRRELTAMQKRTFWLCLAFPVLASFLQLIAYGLAFSQICSILAAATLYIYTLNQQTELFYKKDRESADMRMAIMTTQIQPHFLYNTLDSIYYLCGKDSSRAQQAVADFSEYLRGNLSALSDREPVPFSKELHHVETYLKLERMSSEDTLDYEIDCPVQSFLVPALSIQPLVENAVKHGLGKKPGGGKVIIRSRRSGDRILISILDNGVGFDPDREPRDGRLHVGIANVRTRITEMCGGRLDISSTPGVGTLALVTLPGRRKEE